MIKPEDWAWEEKFPQNGSLRLPIPSMLQGNPKAPTAQWRTARDVRWLAVAVEDAFLPAAVLVGVEGKDWEDVVLQT